MKRMLALAAFLVLSLLWPAALAEEPLQLAPHTESRVESTQAHTAEPQAGQSEETEHGNQPIETADPLSSDDGSAEQSAPFAFDAQGFETDSATGYPLDSASGLPFDPATGYLVDSETRQPLGDQSGPVDAWLEAFRDYEDGDDEPQPVAREAKAQADAPGDAPGDAPHPNEDDAISAPVAMDGRQDLALDGADSGSASDPMRSVRIKASLRANSAVRVGQSITLTAVPMGYSGLNYKLQWQRARLDADGNLGAFRDVEGERGLSCTFTFTDDNINDQWRVVLRIVD